MKYLLASTIFVFAIFYSCLIRGAAYGNETDLLRSDKVSSSPADFISLAGWWKFKQGEYVRDGQFIDSVKLPGTMDTNGKGNPVEESFTDDVPHVGEDLQKSPAFTNRLSRLYTCSDKALYQKNIDIPDNWAGKDVFLLLERTRETRVWINENYAGQQNSLGTAQLYDISDFVVSGRENRITVEVDNGNYSAGNWITGSHMATEETTTNWNGITGTIKLLAKDRVHIKSVKVYPMVTEKIARIKMTIKSSVNTNGTISLRISSRNSAKPHTLKNVNLKFRTNGEDICLNYDFRMGNNVEFWSEFSPITYDLAVDLVTDGGRFKDSEKVNFGMREFKVTSDGKQFSINGITTFLRGEANCNVFPITGYCPMDKADWITFLDKFKQLGVNHMRFHTWCPPKAAFEAADELGIYMQPELYLFGGRRGSDPFAKYDTYAYMKEEGERILEAYANHPSFVMMAFGNEGATADLRKIDLYNYFKKIDPSRLYSEGSATFFWSDNTGDDAIGDFRTSYKTKYGYCRMQFYAEDSPQSASRNYDDVIAHLTVPFISHELGQCAVFPQYDEIEKYKNTVFRAKNLEFFRNMMTTKGMAEQNRDFRMATGRWATIFQRDEIEAVFRTAKPAGFQFLSFQDFPGQGTALVGIYDAFMDSKNIAPADEIRRYNSDMVLLAVIPKYVWTFGEQFLVEIKAANYGPASLSNVVPGWCLKTSTGNIIASGKLPKVNIEQGGLSSIGTISQVLNDITFSQKLILEVRIEGTSHVTDYPVWVYPNGTEVSIPPDIHVTRHYDSETKRILQSGGRVVWLPDPDNLNPKKSISGKFLPDFWSKMFHDYEKNDSYTMGLLIDSDHPALKGFPTEFHTNWQWYDLVKASRSVILDNVVPHSYRPIVQTIDHFDRNHRLGNIFEAKVGRGKLLICTFDLPDLLKTRPEARQLYESLLAYVSGNAFNPSDVFPEAFFDELQEK